MACETAVGSSYGLASASLVIISSITEISWGVGARAFPPRREDFRGSSEDDEDRWRGVASFLTVVVVVKRWGAKEGRAVCGCWGIKEVQRRGADAASRDRRAGANKFNFMVFDFLRWLNSFEMKMSLRPA